ncbi:M24 family metallopeptidase [Muriicola sp. Z0-33]|uniref:M24 family metallopeptidase n=1 Tax=Muriicola sp. Z0-33 TaxID=2816957 RepID=UPI0022380AAB|nr:Xaa-Pro peptidase family protein [Muriicola sp. Z0-33]MCW5515908.1 aminopeptidase P family protein [Muriicola sp. Z0-33]
MVLQTRLFLALFWATAILCAQTPKQSYLDWTSLPFSIEELSKRRLALVKNLQDRGITGSVLIPSRDGFSTNETFRQLDDFYYFTGLELPNSILVLDITSNWWAVYGPEEDFRFENKARPNDFPGRALINDPGIETVSGLSLRAIEEFSVLMDQYASNGTTVIVNGGNTKELASWPQDYFSTPTPIQILLRSLEEKHPGLSYRNCFSEVASIRMIKSEAEIALMRKSTAINIAGIKKAANAVRAGIDERYLEGVLEGSYKKNGAQRLAFGSIIKSGPNSLWPWRILATHYNRRNRNLENGDLVIMDVGCEYNNYVSDVGRTFPVSGKFTEMQSELLNMQVEISDAIIAYIKPGVTFSDLRKLTDEIIPEEAKPYMQANLFFGHHLGLSVGDPSLDEATLEAGMIFTVEPWYYNHEDEIAVFTEDVVLVTEDGCEVLSKDLPRTPEDLERLMHTNNDY